MEEDSYFLDYMMLPRNVDGIGDVYPIKLNDYFKFKTLANKYIIYGRKWLINICKQPKKVNVFDYIINSTLAYESYCKVMSYTPQNEEEIRIKNEISNYTFNVEMYIEEIELLLKMVLHKELKFHQISDTEFCFKDDEVEINRRNYDVLREVIMSQNLLYEPPSSSSDFINDMIK